MPISQAVSVCSAWVLHIKVLASCRARSPPDGSPGLGMIELGRATLLICFCAAIYALAAGLFAASQRRRRRLAVSAENALICSFVAAGIAFAVLIVAFVRRDFSFVSSPSPSPSSGA